MKFKVTKEEYAALDAETMKLYKAEGEEFQLEVEGLPEVEDVSGLKKNLADLLTEKKEAKRLADEATASAAEIKTAADLAAANKSGDLDAINKSWQEKFDKQSEQITSLNGALNKSTSGATAISMAASMSVKGSESILADAITSRLKTNFEDGVATTVVLDAQGKPSALTVDELKAEFMSNAAYAPLIIGSKAGGGGTNNDNSKGGANGKVIPRSDFDAMGPIERQSHLKEGGTLTDDTN